MNKSYYYSTPIPSSQDIPSSPIFPFLPLFILDLSSMSQLLDKQYSSLPPLEDNHEQAKLIPFFPPYEISSSRYGIPYQASKTGTYSDEDHDHQDDDDQYYPSEKSNESLVLRITTPVTNNEEDNRNTKMYSGNTNSCDGTAKWMSSKMRLMRKMMNSYPHQKILHRSSINNSANSSNGCVRACSDCNTTKTPLWRSGPQGPKSLCNACGIRQRKARKAVAAAEKTSNDDPCKIKKVSVGSCNAAIPYKKRYKLEQTRKIQLEDFSNISLKKKTASFHPQDEKEAAILLMALSCDLIYG